MSLLFKIDENSKTATIQLPNNVIGGEFALQFAQSINELINSNISNVLIDCSNVEIMNSSGLGMLVSAHTTLKKSSSNLSLFNINDKVMSLFKMTHLDSVFSIYQSYDEIPTIN